VSLNWKLDKIENWKEVCLETRADGKEYLKAVTDDLIMLTSGGYIINGVGISTITKKNWKDFYTRMVLLHGDIKISKEDVKAHIGLMTNGSTLTKSEFLNIVYTKKKDSLFNDRRTW